MTTRHRNWTITYNPKPGVRRVYDYDAVHDDYDGAEDSRDVRFFSAPSLEIAIEEINDLENENGRD